LPPKPSTEIIRHVSIELLSDIAHPWCYIDFVRIQKAREEALRKGIVTSLEIKPVKMV
jgi:predicted DsbA family dithiol-disulfide isomerase